VRALRPASRLLSRRFSSEYERYRRRVPALIPRLLARYATDRDGGQ
jgi:protein-S-isoprenylcysteine O-methyltransferase Ste14